MPVVDALGFQGGVEVPAELRAVVREHAAYWDGEEDLVQLPGPAGLLAGEVLHPECEGKAAGQIGGGDQMTLARTPSMRASVRSRPSSATVASMGGEIAVPVTATRTGCAILPRPAPVS